MPRALQKKPLNKGAWGRNADMCKSLAGGRAESLTMQ